MATFNRHKSCRNSSRSKRKRKRIKEKSQSIRSARHFKLRVLLGHASSIINSSCRSSTNALPTPINSKSSTPKSRRRRKLLMTTSRLKVNLIQMEVIQMQIQNNTSGIHQKPHNSFSTPASEIVSNCKRLLTLCAEVSSSCVIINSLFV